MNNDFYKMLSKAMEKVENDSINAIYILNPDVELKAQNLYSKLISSEIKAKIEYSPAYMQITVIAETPVLDICTNNFKQSLLNADVVCVDALSNGILHIECMFNNAFRKVGI
ncbi:MAG: hypothetical protein K5664_06375 [Firmicutes bacterium]|nr:hypothetical protein [Bacillota bacterium]